MTQKRYDALEKAHKAAALLRKGSGKTSSGSKNMKHGFHDKQDREVAALKKLRVLTKKGSVGTKGWSKTVSPETRSANTALRERLWNKRNR